LGFIVDLLSHATIIGFMGGAATVVILQQLKGMLGLERFTTATDIISVMESVFSQTHQVPHTCIFTYIYLCTNICIITRAQLRSDRSQQTI
jgi:MFS superfamily sulfate permease-like transporter